MRGGGVLYISYDGMLEPLGQSQVLGYVERLAAELPMHLISFEKPEDWNEEDKRARIASRISQAGIHWHPLNYHRRPTAPATAYDIAQGIRLGAWLVMRHRLSIVHARSYVPSVMALAIKRLTGARYLFDMRGFWADERVDAGMWAKEGRLYHVAKHFQQRFLQAADAVVSLTHAASAEISSFAYLAGRVPPITVIPTCADLDRFTPRVGAAPARFTLGFVGSAGTWNQFSEVLSFFKAVRARRPDARLLVVNRGEHDLIRKAVTDCSLDNNTVEITAADHFQVPDLIRKMTAGTAMRKPAYSNLGSAPTKIAEYLGCGIPCLGNGSVGDVAEILEGRRVGIAMTSYSKDDHAAAADRLLMLLEEPEVSARCRQTAEAIFSLDKGVEAYWRIYASLQQH